MKSASLQELYIVELETIYLAKKEFTAGMRRMLGKTRSPELRTALGLYLAQSGGQISRLRSLFRSINLRPRSRKSGTSNLIAGERSCRFPTGTCLGEADTSILENVQRAVDEEMTSYSYLRDYARLLYFDDAALLLQDSLEENGEVDRQLQLLMRMNRPARMSAELLPA